MGGGYSMRVQKNLLDFTNEENSKAETNENKINVQILISEHIKPLGNLKISIGIKEKKN